VRVDFVTLAGGTAFDIGCNEVMHVGPPVMWCDEVSSFGNSRVASS